jgi:hypothetical protein
VKTPTIPSISSPSIAGNTTKAAKPVQKINKAKISE